jgi:hypothetical protein
MQAADDVFRTFVTCDKSGRRDFNEILKCTKPLFVSTMTNPMVRRYSDATIFPTQYSELFECDADMKRVVKAYEDAKYDLYYCFESNLTQTSRVGVVFFKLEAGAPKILKLKL